MSPFEIALNFGQQAHTDRGQRLRGRWGLVPLLPKRGLLVRKVFPPKTVSLVPKEDGLQAFAWRQSTAFIPFINISSGPRRKKTIFNTWARGVHEKWKIWPKSQYWDVYTHGTPRLV